MILLHGFLGTWRTWELVLPALERRHDVLALTMAGHTRVPGAARPRPAWRRVAQACELLGSAGRSVVSR